MCVSLVSLSPLRLSFLPFADNRETTYLKSRKIFTNWKHALCGTMFQTVDAFLSHYIPMLLMIKSIISFAVGNARFGKRIYV